MNILVKPEIKGQCCALRNQAVLWCSLVICVDVSQLFTSKSDLAYSKIKTNIVYKAYLFQGI